MREAQEAPPPDTPILCPTVAAAGTTHHPTCLPRGPIQNPSEDPQGARHRPTLPQWNTGANTNSLASNSRPTTIINPLPTKRVVAPQQPPTMGQGPWAAPLGGVISIILDTTTGLAAVVVVILLVAVAADPHFIHNSNSNNNMTTTTRH